MTSIIKILSEKQVIQPPKFLSTSTHYETIMGSVAYGIKTEDSDVDVMGFCIPPKINIFPHLNGEILGFGTPKTRFEQYQMHHSYYENKQYDLTIFNIVKYFSLCMANNPNMIDSLFTPDNCVLHITSIGHMVRNFRKQFLHKGSYHKFKGYAFSQLHKMSCKNPEEGSKRRESVDKFGFDVKFATHTVRLLCEAEMILDECDLDIQKNKTYLKSIRNGEVPEEDIKNFFSFKEKELEKKYETSKLQNYPDEEKIKQLLLSCLEEHYGNLDNCIEDPNKYLKALRNIKEIIDKENL